MEVHHGDVLEFDMEKLCDPHVERKAWEEGKNRLMERFLKRKHYTKKLTFTEVTINGYSLLCPNNVSHFPHI